MKRAIKFRAWDKDSQAMIYQNSANDGTVDESIVIGFDGFAYLLIEKDNGDKVIGESGMLEPMQFTGLTDKNGKEIYEGDIYSHNGKSWLVKYSENQFVLLTKEVGSKTNWRSLEDVNRMSKYIEVIGNIYETPELLK